MVHALQARIQPVVVKPKQWVRMKRGIYKGDLAQVFDVDDQKHVGSAGCTGSSSSGGGYSTGSSTCSHSSSTCSCNSSGRTGSGISSTGSSGGSDGRCNCAQRALWNTLHYTTTITAICRHQPLPISTTTPTYIHTYIQTATIRFVPRIDTMSLNAKKDGPASRKAVKVPPKLFDKKDIESRGGHVERRRDPHTQLYMDYFGSNKFR